MKMSVSKASALAAITLVGAAHAQSTVGPSNVEVAFYTDGNHFVVQPDPAASPFPETQTSGLNLLNTPSNGQVYDFCSQFYVGRNETNTYNVTNGLNGFTSTEQANVQALLSNVLPAFQTMLSNYIAQVGQGNWDGNPTERANLNAYAAGIQMAIWELVDETNNTLELDNSKSGKGTFAVDLTAPASANVLEGENYGVQFVNNVKNGTWVDRGGIVYYTADSAAVQDRIWAQVVPETSSSLLGLVGAGLLLRRRRN
ncbi:MAG: hypothetical protein JWO82_1212 [Akkermansiaceae bacterium]|nr:hypothetical protein [Akkermansiaceae bacterium]